MDILADIISLIFCGYVFYLRKEMHRLQASLGNITAIRSVDPAVGDLCIVKTVRFEDGHVAEKHSHCGGCAAVAISDDWAPALHPGSPVRSIQTSTHKI